MTSCIVGKKIRAMGPGPLELFPFVVHAIKLCIVGKKISARSLRVISLCCSGYTDGQWHLFVPKISHELLYLET